MASTSAGGSPNTPSRSMILRSTARATARVDGDVVKVYSSSTDRSMPPESDAEPGGGNQRTDMCDAMVDNRRSSASCTGGGCDAMALWYGATAVADGNSLCRSKPELRTDLGRLDMYEDTTSKNPTCSRVRSSGDSDGTFFASPSPSCPSTGAAASTAFADSRLRTASSVCTSGTWRASAARSWNSAAPTASTRPVSRASASTSRTSHAKRASTRLSKSSVVDATHGEAWRRPRVNTGFVSWRGRTPTSRLPALPDVREAVASTAATVGSAAASAPRFAASATQRIWLFATAAGENGSATPEESPAPLSPSRLVTCSTIACGTTGATASRSTVATVLTFDFQRSDGRGSRECGYCWR